MKDPALTIELLGGLRMRQDDRILVEFPPQQTGLLLAYLALHGERAFTREEVIEALLPDLDAETGRHRLRQYLHGLRQELAACSLSDEHLLLTARNRLRLNPEAARVDVAQFTANLHAASTATDLPERIHLLTAAVALYRGELLPGFYEESINAERLRLADIYHNALLTLAIAYKQAGDMTRALEYIQKVIALDPLQEEAHCEAMRLYAASGQMAAAQRQYQRLTALLREELDVEPSAETQQLMQTLRANGKSPTTAPVESLSLAPPVSAPSPSVPPPSPVESAPVMALSRRLRSSRLLLALGALAVLIASALVWRWPSRSHPHAALPPAASSANADPPGTYGTEAWVLHVPPLPGESDSDPTGLATDDSGNIYVTGFVQTKTHDVDYLILKCDPRGNLLWQRRWNGPQNDCDRARSLALDSANNIYVTGDSYNGDQDKGGTDYDVVTLKYDTNGNLKWMRRYDGAAHGQDWAKKIAVDGAGNIYVGATSVGLTSHGTPRSDFLILKYDTDGNLLWERRYNTSGLGNDDLTDMALDRAGNLCVTGTGKLGDGHTNIVTLQYDSAGKLRWAQRYGGPGEGDDKGPHITVDTRGNVYVVGTVFSEQVKVNGLGVCTVTMKYDAGGNLKWVQTYPEGLDSRALPAAIVVDGAGNVTIAGGSRGQLFVVAYDSRGWKRWVRSVAPADGKGTGIETMASVLAVDAAGNILVSGQQHQGSTPKVSDVACAFLSYDAQGARRWLALYSGPVKGGNVVRAMVLDAGGSPIVVAQSQEKGYRGIVILRY